MLLLRRSIGSLLVGAVTALGGCGDARPPSLPASAYEGISDPTQRTTAGVVTAANQPGTPPPARAPERVTGPADSWTGRAESFRGDLGDVARFDGVNAVIRGSDTAESSTVRIDAEDTSARWWAMTRLDVTGTLRHPALVPGARLTFTPGTTPRMPAGMAPLSVRAVGCSGPRLDDMAFDVPAEQVTFAVSAGPSAGTQRLDFTASFVSASGAQEVTGSFVYEVL